VNDAPGRSGARGPTILRSGSPDFETIGYSLKRRALLAHFCGNPSARCRILIIAGQHGDEGDATKAAAEFLNGIRRGALHCDASLAILVEANPDGTVAGSRVNDNGSDLNRDHVLLAEPETRAIHTFVALWNPDLIVDVHTYRPGRPELLKHQLLFSQEIMIDYPTNPATRLLAPQRLWNLLRKLKTKLGEAGIRCDRYTLVRPSGIVRHSSTDIVDARNGLSLRYGIPTVLVEGRRPSPDDRSQFVPTHYALVRAMGFIVEWAAAQLPMDRTAWPGHSPIPLSCRYVGSGRPLRMEMQSTVTGIIRSFRIPGDYAPRVRSSIHVQPPRAYAVPRRFGRIIDVLERQNFRSVPPARNDRNGWSYRIMRAPSASSEARVQTAAVCKMERLRFDPEEFVVLPVAQSGGHMLTLLLEPQSKFGLHRFGGLGLTFVPESIYPILRLS